MKKTKINNIKAFTIVELVIVISIVAILSAVLIPTFINLKNKADLSSDEQTVRQMNIVLESDEKLNGKKTSVLDVSKVLEGNGYDVNNINAISKDNVMYWDKDSNRMLLFSKSQNKVIYPSLLVNRYKDLTSPSMLWFKINNTVSTNIVEDFESLKEQVSIANEENIIFKFSSNTTIENFNNSFPLAPSKNTVYDLNGNTLTLNATSGSLLLSEGNKLHLKNGKVNISRSNVDTTSAAIYVKSGSAITLENVELYSDGCAIYPEGAASEINIISSKVTTTGAYCVSTNSNSKENYYVNIYIKDSQLSATDSDSCAVLLNVPGSLRIEDSQLYAGRQGLFVRCGNAYVNKSTITVSGSYSKNTDYQDYLSKAWGSGNNAPSCALLIGSYQSNNKGAYQADAICTIENSKIISKEKTIPGIYVQGNATFVGTQYKAELKYQDNNEIIVENSETINNIVIRGTVNGGSIVNGISYTTDHYE